MLYLASGYEEIVEEVFESRVTRWNPWMDVRMLEHAATDVGGRQERRTSRRDVRERAGVRACGSALGHAAGRAGARPADSYGCTVHPRARPSPEMVSAREEEEEAETFGARVGYPWAASGSHGSRGKIGRKLGSRLVAHSKFGVRIKRRIVDMHGKTDLMSPRLALSVEKCPESV
ncbi:hypothetical protein CDL15_Pgr026296 [Punica granatum]|uniref:Uncharacterized protein n=1 Tax=Punica granatum TaxID=22663 RepID=A0A218XVY5_PUNGR|nr:hypothetical protein CDL15_Pgr026296 [Punica granatum]PKI69649.1 hypothetical protein CRG98_009920 [Punica granatum]